MQCLLCNFDSFPLSLLVGLRAATGFYTWNRARDRLWAEIADARVIEVGEGVQVYRRVLAMGGWSTKLCDSVSKSRTDGG